MYQGNNQHNTYVADFAVAGFVTLDCVVEVHVLEPAVLVNLLLVAQLTLITNKRFNISTSAPIGNKSVTPAQLTD